jgi:signal transduction histidine kinase
MAPEQTGKSNPMHIPPWTLAVAASLLVGVLDIAAVLTAGVGKAPLHNPLGLLAIALSGDWRGTPDVQHLARAYPVYVAIKLVVCTLAIVLAGASCARAPVGRRMAILAGQLACALALDSLPFHVVAAIHLGMLLPWRQALAMLLAHYLAGVAVDTLLVLDLAQRTQEPHKWTLLAYLSAERTIIGAGFLAARLVLREHRTRQSLAMAHAQILATQSLLTETVRGAERLRIARDLHDTIGHHLTALNLHLDLAVRQAPADAPLSLVTARGVSGELLAQVRGVVSDSRRDRGIDLAHAVRLLCDAIPGLVIDLRVDSDASEYPAPVAHALYSCIQEAVTNTLRHAQAARLSIELRTQEDMTIVRVADDGRGGPNLSEGNGLRGMRERLACLDGELLIRQRPGSGLTLEMRLPRQWAPT